MILLFSAGEGKQMPAAGLPKGEGISPLPRGDNKKQAELTLPVCDLAVTGGAESFLAAS